METSDWFNIWDKRYFPYQELLQGDILYWMDSVKKTLTWKTEVIEVIRFAYDDKGLIFKRYGHSMTKSYFDSRPDKGYFLGYKVKVIDKMNISKPNYSFARIAWERLDTENSKRWFNNDKIIDNTTIDENINNKGRSITDKLKDLNDKMQFVSPERVSKLILTTIRKDTTFIKLLKEASDYSCQYPDCGHQIKTKDNGYYIEVAHIAPVSVGGRSVIGNLLVLCPNHHKEFDYGERIINEQTDERLIGTLNGKAFEIVFTY
jgi:hypothetical protein